MKLPWFRWALTTILIAMVWMGNKYALYCCITLSAIGAEIVTMFISVKSKQLECENEKMVSEIIQRIKEKS